MSPTVQFYFHGNLNDFLPPKRREQWVAAALQPFQTVKDAMEALGVPHVEAGCITVNGKEVGFSYFLQREEKVAVFPYPPAAALHFPQKFVLDVHLGKLARLLRMMGIDTVYENGYNDQAIAALSQQQNRAVLTRDIGLLKQKNIQYGYWLRSQHPQEQLVEVVRRFDLCGQFSPFSRCIACNGPLQKADKAAVAGQLPPMVEAQFSIFYQCSHCRKVYWEGSHVERMKRMVATIRSICSS